MMTWSHSGSFLSPIIIYKHTQLIGKIWRKGEEGGRSPRARFSKLHIKPFEQFEGSRTFTKLNKPLLPKNGPNNPAPYITTYLVIS